MQMKMNKIIAFSISRSIQVSLKKILPKVSCHRIAPKLNLNRHKLLIGKKEQQYNETSSSVLFSPLQVDGTTSSSVHLHNYPEKNSQFSTNSTYTIINYICSILVKSCLKINLRICT